MINQIYRERKGDGSMLTWYVTYHCKKGQRAAFYQGLCDLGVREASRAEFGNLRYEYYLSAEKEDDLLLVESWTNPSFQKAHCQTERFQKLQELKARYCRRVEIDKYNW